MPTSTIEREEFEAAYAARSLITVAYGYTLGIFPAVPCACDDVYCEGWRRRYQDDDERELH